MKISRFKLIISISFVMMLTLTSVAFAHSSDDGRDGGRHDDRHKTRVKLRNATVPWEVPYLLGGPDEMNYECADIPAGLQISPLPFESNRNKRAIVKELRRDDARKITLKDTVWGTAVDQYGQTYDFLYKNRATLRYNGRGVVDVKMVDDFWLKGGDVDYTVSFVWHWSYEAPDGIEVAKFYDGHTLVNLNASPFAFATADGFTENPAIIPGSWNQVETNGFIFGCDPI